MKRIAANGILLLTGIWFLISMFMINCSDHTSKNEASQLSDQKAIEIADSVIQRLGGQESWDNTHYLAWRFFGGRLHIWDKWSGNIRFEDKDLLVLMNVNTRQGKAWKNKQSIRNPDTLALVLNNTYKKWINDSYWFIMPYKLKDPGVHLKYKGIEKMQNGRPAYVLTLTFDDVGITPQNKYDVYVDKESMLVRQWAYYKNAVDEKPMFMAPWNNWHNCCNILLSDDRGPGRKFTDIYVFDELPPEIFQRWVEVNLKELQ